MMEKFIGKKEKWINKGTDKQYVADSLLHSTTCHTQCLILDFPRKRRCLYSALSFTHLLRLKQQWFSVVNTCRI